MMAIAMALRCLGYGLFCLGGVEGRGAVDDLIG